MSTSFLLRVSIGRRLVLSFAAMVALLITVAALDAAEIRAMSGRLQQIVEVNNAKSGLANRMLDQINEMAIQARSITLIDDVKLIKAEVVAMKATQARYAKTEADLVARIAETDASAAEKQLVDEIVATGKKTVPLIAVAASQGEDGAQADAVGTLMKKVRPLETAWRTKVGELIELEDQQSRRAYETAIAAQRRSLMIVLAFVACAVGSSVVLGWRITRSIKRPIDRAMHVVERIADGDLSSEVVVGSHDEIGRLLHGVSGMQDRLRDLVGQIRQSADSIRTASEEVATGNADLSQRTEHAASSLQQTAASMEQFTGSLRNSADSAGTAKQLASSAAMVAQRGEVVVAEVVSTMDQINNSSKKIADIIGVIDAIAFQTNILALNAAVEAARAGEQGRGFAVVAGEVRNLAGRSADAAKEIKQLIGTSVDKVAIGAKLVKDAGSTMSEIMTSVRRVSDIIAEISAGSIEQSTGVGQMNIAVTQLDKMTQQNAALVEQSAAAAESLKNQSLRLTDLVGSFRLRQEIAAV